MTSTWSPRKFSQAEIDGMRDTEVFGHADSLIMCLEDWDVQVAIAAGKRLSTLPPTVLEGFAPALSRSVVGVGLLHRAQQLVPSLLPVVAPDPGIGAPSPTPSPTPLPHLAASMGFFAPGPPPELLPPPLQLSHRASPFVPMGAARAGDKDDKTKAL